MKCRQLTGLPGDVTGEVLGWLTADSCGALRATSKTVGCHLISEAYLTARLDTAICNKGLSGVLTYRRRPQTAREYLVQRVTATCSVFLPWLVHLVTILAAVAALIALFRVCVAVPTVARTFVVQLFGPRYSMLVLPVVWFLLIRGGCAFGTAFGNFLGRHPSLRAAALRPMPAFRFMAANIALAARRAWAMVTSAVTGSRADRMYLWGELRGALPDGGKSISHPEYLLRLLYVIEEGGRWERSVPLIYFIKNSHLILSLPIIVSADDLRRVGSRAVFDSRPDAVRQYSLFSHRFTWMAPHSRLSRVDGQDRLGPPMRAHPMTFLTPDTLPASIPLAIDFNASDPPTQCVCVGCNLGCNLVAASFTDHVVLSLSHLASAASDPSLLPYDATDVIPVADQQRLKDSIGQAGRAIWRGHRLVDVCDSGRGGRRAKMAILCGCKATDEFAVRVALGGSGMWDVLEVSTTERVVWAGKGVAERFPRTAAVLIDVVEALSVCV
ncbi:unnamed protein product [Vitrella brassicaformis CCMP3155]|uniref:Uncharacterized protein n=1 Tax=Vitrella brassicaformis (strain CCMP3155) TaxID=1169540 RepID=A0A0G4GTH2_VITBC|nr:unnamed protein product [Vitrella brassicaformis CCMP3155]|eukprot:CEM34072.1 unnamed protein product [Vitrella brassicaformis CCMP3155]